MTIRASLSRVDGAVGNFAMLISLAADIAFFRHSFSRTVKDLELDQMVAVAGGLTGERKAEQDFFLGWGLAFLCGTYCKLLRKRLSYDERKALVLLAALAAPYDDLFDKHRISGEHLHRVLDDLSYTPTSSDERLARRLYRELIALSPAQGNTRFHEAMRELHAAQLDSIHRLNASSPLELAKEVTYAKARAGQAAMLALITGSNTSPEERDAEAGGAAWVQLCDDALDRREDRAGGGKTLLTECHRFADAAEVLERHRISVFEKYRALRNRDERRREEFLFRWYVLAALSMTYLYLDDEVERGALPAIRMRDAIPLACKLIAGYSRDVSMRPIMFPPSDPPERRGSA